MSVSSEHRDRIRLGRRRGFVSPGIRYLAACLAVALGSSAASAQPLFKHEHDWTFTIGGRRYGFWDVAQMPGDFRWTQVWVGGWVFEPARQTTRWRADRLVLALIPAG